MQSLSNLISITTGRMICATKNTNIAEINENLIIRSEEGKPAVLEAIEELKKTSLPPMSASSFLEMAAVDHQVDSSKNNIIGHKG